jgi:hypothetical protein
MALAVALAGREISTQRASRRSPDRAQAAWQRGHQ